MHITMDEGERRELDTLLRGIRAQGSQPSGALEPRI